jgi:hypothetical protein
MFKKICFLLSALSIAFSAESFARKPISGSSGTAFEREMGIIDRKGRLLQRYPISKRLQRKGLPAHQRFKHAPEAHKSKRNIRTEKPAIKQPTNRFSSKHQNLKKKPLANNKKMVSREQTPKSVFLVNRRALAAKKQAIQADLLAKRKAIAARTQTPKDSLLAKNRALATKKQATQATILAKEKAVAARTQTPKDASLRRENSKLPKKPVSKAHIGPSINNKNNFQSGNSGIIINKDKSRNGYSINGQPMSENEKKEFEKEMTKFNKDMEKMSKMFEKDPFFNKVPSGRPKPVSKTRKGPANDVAIMVGSNNKSHISSSNNGINLMSINGVTTVNGVRIPNKNGSTTIDKNTTAHVKDGLIKVTKKDSCMNSTTIINTKDYSVITAGPILKNGGPDFSKIGPLSR